MPNERDRSEIPDRHEEPLRVLVVEDSPRDAELEVATLTRAGYLVRHEVAPTKDIFRDLLTHRNFDIILADFNLQNWTGLDALDILKKSGKDIPVVIVTGSLGDETAVDCIKEGAADYVLKDRLARLPLAVRRALKERDLLRERAQAQEALRQSEERFRSLIANSSDVICLVSREGKITFASSSVARILGYSPEELVGQDGFGLVHPEDLDHVKMIFREVLRTPRKVTQVEYRYRHKDGSWRWIEVYSQNLLEDPSVQSVIVNSRDTTARQIAQKKIRESEEQFRTIIAGVRDYAIFMLDTDGRVLTWNPGAERIEGYKAEEIVGSDFSVFFPEEDIRSGEPQRVLEAAAARGGIEYEGRHVRKDGSQFWANVVMTSLRDEKGDLRGFVKVTRDTTERKLAEEKLQESEERFRLISENVDDLIAVVDLAGKRLYNSPSYNKVLGDPETLRGTVSFNEIHPEDREKVKEVFQETVRTGVGQRAEFRFLLRDGSVRYIESQGSVIHDRKGKPSRVVVVSRDVTERKSLENQLLQSQKMEAVGRLAGGVAHDFNNLLTVIMGFSEMLREQLGPDTPLRAHADEILKAGGRAAMLTRQLLAFSRKQVLAPQILDLNTLVADMDKMLRRLIREDIQLHSTLSQKLGPVKADPGQIEQIILNLVVNARDAMPNGGMLTIETADIDLDQAFAQRHMNITPGPYVMLTVSDTGTGMDAETQSHIFEPFFTTKKEGKGTGLGLATVYGIVKQSGGSIWVYSEPGRGTTFKVYFRRADEIRMVEEAPAAPRALSVGEETILIVEDEESVRALTRIALQQRGFTVLEARHGEEALHLAKEHSGPIHLLVTDVVMPGINGRDVASRIEILHPGAKVLFISGYTDDAVIRHGVLESGVAFLQKPFTPDTLVRKVREVLDQAA